MLEMRWGRLSVISWRDALWDVPPQTGKRFLTTNLPPGPFPLGVSISTSDEEPWLGASKDRKERFYQFLQLLVSQPSSDRNHVSTLQHSCRRHSPAFTVRNCAFFSFFCAVRKLQRALSRLYFLWKWHFKKKKSHVLHHHHHHHVSV